FEDEDLRARLARLHQAELADKILEKALNLIPQVDWIFYKPAQTAQELAKELAEVTKRIERVIPDVYQQEGQEGYLHNLLESFQKELLPNLKLTSDNPKDYSFSDIYAQTIAYGLFTAKIGHTQNPEEFAFNRTTASIYISDRIPFLKGLFDLVLGTGSVSKIHKSIENLIELFNRIDMTNILEN
ncbi:MAG: N-6 DNA methylase, partial [Dolichospermum sp.]